MNGWMSSLGIGLVVGVSIVGGCARRAPVEPVAMATSPMGEHAVAHASGTCALCDLYYLAKQSVVLVRVERSLGTGVIVREDGLIVTNAHVVGDAEEVGIELSDGSMARAKVVKRDERADLALLEIVDMDRSWLALMLEGDDRPQVGTDIYIIGHPLGLGWSVSRGVVSGHRRAGEVGAIAYIQTDAAISPGNSGGPMVTGDGRIVGIVVSKLAGSGAENIAFAIPVADVRAFIEASMPTE